MQLNKTVFQWQDLGKKKKIKLHRNAVFIAKV